VVWLRTIEGAAHLIPVEPERNCIVNKRVDYHVWNEMNDVWEHELNGRVRRREKET
jgi:hypothetical protein